MRWVTGGYRIHDLLPDACTAEVKQQLILAFRIVGARFQHGALGMRSEFSHNSRSTTNLLQMQTRRAIYAMEIEV